MLKKITSLMIVLLSATAVFAQNRPPAPTPTPEPARYRIEAVPEAQIKAPAENHKNISGGVLNGRAIKLPKPAYPAAARAEGAHGAVNVQVLIDEEGKVVSAVAISGPATLRDAAAEAARGATFTPVKLEGKPVKVSGIITYNFVVDLPPGGPVKTESKQSKKTNDVILTVGFILSFIQTGDSELMERMGGRQSYTEFLRSVAANVPEALETERGLFDELANANEKERPAIAVRISEIIKKNLREEQKWHLLAGMHLGDVISEFIRIGNNGPPAAGGRLDTSALESHLRLLNDVLTSVPAAASPDLVSKLGNIGASANSKDLGTLENLTALWKAMEEFIDMMINNLPDN